MTKRCFKHQGARGILAYVCLLVMAILVGGLVCGCAQQEKAFPSKAITIICPWSAGGGSDRLSRFMADQLQARLGQPAVVVNKTGGSGAIGFAAGANAPADGYTITMATFELSTMHWMGISKLTDQNFAPLVQLNGDAAAIIVRKDSPFKTLDSVLAYIRENPGKLKLSGTAKGAAWDLARCGFLMAAGLPVDSVVWVPAKGAAPAIVELLGGHIDVVSCSVPEALTQIESGELVALAVMAPERLANFPTIPTCRELGVNWDAIGYRGLALPRGTPDDVVRTLSNACLEIANSEEFRTFMKKNGFAPAVRGPAEFGRFLREQDEQWHKVILGANIGANSLQSDSKNHDLGPWAFPATVGTAVLLGIALQLRRTAVRLTIPPALARATGLLGIYIITMPYLGFFTASLGLAVYLARSQGRSWLSAWISSAVLLLIVYLLFERAFQVPLPTGLLF
jgi:tripartite-type tricarboxylate transporter receptor subunit TctC